MTTPADVRFWAKIDKEGPVPEHAPELGRCWLWTGAKNGNGRPNFGPRSYVHVYAYRFAYELLVGPIPAGLDLDHLCREITCVNPSHLEPVTRAENLRRRPLPTHCPQGHAYDEVNTHVDRRNQRHCRACDAERHREARRVRAERPLAEVA